MILDPGTTLDRYVIDGVVGRGGMAVVYRGHHAQLGTPVAIKVLTVLSSDVQARLMNEGRTQGRLRHPNIVSVLDVVLLNQFPCLVMELVEGPNLAALITKRRPAVEQCDMLARGVMEGISVAHKAGVIHRDLKPENVLVEVAWNGLIPKVTDFGLVKALHGSDAGMSATRTGTAMGTPSYMAPEQFRDAGRVDARADVFSLGAVLYELLTGRQAFSGGDLIAVYTASSTNNWRPVEELVPDVPARMVAAIRGALQADLDARFPSVEALLDAWTNGGEPVRSDGRVTGIWSSPELEEARALTPTVPSATPPPTSSVPPSSRPTFAVPMEALVATNPSPTLRDWGSAEATEETSGVPTPPRSRLGGLAMGVLAGVALVAMAGVAVGVAVPLLGGGGVPDGVAVVPAADAEAVAVSAPGGATAATVPLPGVIDPAPATETVGAAGTAMVAEAPTTPSGGTSVKPSEARAARLPTSAPATSTSTKDASPSAVAAAPTVAVRLRVNSVPPPQEVRVDGVPLPSPAKGAELPVGPHALQIVSTDGRTTRVDIALREGQPLTFCWNFNDGAPCPR